jgi:hypothetical protein
MNPNLTEISKAINGTLASEFCCLTGNIRQMARRATSTSFKPGQSGNPNGRPRVLADVQNAAREHSAEALETLAQIMRNPKAPAAARISAACALLDRGYGKPPQTVDANNTNVNYVVSDQPMSEDHITFIRSWHCLRYCRGCDV